ncbi:MAG: MFS transporter [Ardenticatenaceae bacterium]|nr:MFS transporter [Ardenticatenaceae bacterium]
MSQLETQNPPEITARDLLRIRDFRLLWLGQIISNFGDSVTHLTLVLFINRITGGDAQAIAWLLIALALPTAVFGLIAGVFVDRWNRKHVMVMSDGLRAALTLGFIIAAATGQIWLIYLLAFGHATVSAFFAPARSAVIPRVVPKEGLLAANSLSQMSVVFFRVLGTGVAGFLVGTLDTFTTAFIIDAITFVLSALLIWQLKVQTQTAVTTTPPSVRHVFTQLRDGLSLIAHSRILIGVMMAGGVAMLGIGALNVLLAPMVVNDLGLPETWFGALEFAQVAAMIISGALVTVLAAKFKPTTLASSGLFLTGWVILPLAFVTHIWQLFPILFALGLLATPLNAGVATLVQTAVSDEILGRISSALNTVIQTASLISMFFAGTVAALVGVRNVFLISGIIVILSGLVAVRIFSGQLTTNSEQLSISNETTV